MKRIKANVWDLVFNDIIFYDHEFKKIDNVEGCFFKCCKFLTDDQKETLKQFKNVRIYRIFKDYSPLNDSEIRYIGETNAVFIGDKNF